MFFPQWVPALPPHEAGPLRTVAAEAARLRGSLRPACAYPVRQILEDAWSSGRLVYTVPWVTSFLRMMVWDPTYAERALNPYFEGLGALRTIQRSDALHPGKGPVSGNRLFVLLEIQGLWTALSIPPSQVKPLPLVGAGLLTKGAKINAGKAFYANRDDSTAADDQSSAFSSSFLRHVTPALSEVVKALRRRRPAALKALGGGVAATTMGASLAPPKRQTPFLVSAAGLAGATSALAASGAAAAFAAAASPPPMRAVAMEAEGLGSLSTPTKATTANDVAGEPVATSLMAQFSAAVKTVPGSSGGNGAFASSFVSATTAGKTRISVETVDTGTLSPPLRSASASALSPMQRTLSPKPATDAPGTGPGSAKAVRRRSISSSYVGAAASPADAAVTAAAAAAGGGSPRAPLGSPADNAAAPITDRLEVAFWQQHPQLQQMCGFVLEHLQKAGLARLRSAVADAVVALWARSAPLKTRAEGAHRSAAAGRDSFTDFSAAMQVEKKTVYAATIQAGREVLRSLVEQRLSGAVAELLALYPCHERVTRLAVWLIQRQARAQRAPLLAYLSSYLSRKLAEVVEASERQAKKALDGLPPAPGPRPSPAGQPTATPSERPAPARARDRDRDRDRPSPMSVSAAALSDGGDSPKAAAELFLRGSADEELARALEEANLFFSCGPSLSEPSTWGPLTQDALRDESLGSIVCRGPDSRIGGSVAYMNSVARLLEAVQSTILAVARGAADAGDGARPSVPPPPSVRATVRNICALLTATVRWAAAERAAAGPLQGASELAGKFSILLVRFFSLNAPALFYLDVADPEHVGAGVGDGGDDDIRLTCPSDVLLVCEARGLAAMDSVAFVLATVARPSTLLYFSHCKGLSGLRAMAPAAVLAFIGKLYRRKNKVAAPVDLSCDPWYADADVRNDVRTVLGAEVANIVANLVKMVAE